MDDQDWVVALEEQEKAITRKVCTRASSQVVAKGQFLAVSVSLIHTS